MIVSAISIFATLNSSGEFSGADVTSGLVSAFVTTIIDYCNSILTALPQSSIDPLQRVQNAAARLTTGTETRKHITPALWSMHQLASRWVLHNIQAVRTHASDAHQPCFWLPVRHGNGNHRSVWSRKTQICEHSRPWGARGAEGARQGPARKK